MADRQAMNAQLTEMKAATNIARRQLEAYERPWLTATVAAYESVLLMKDGSISLMLTPVITNIGKSVAEDIDYRLEPVRLESGRDLRGVVEAMQRVAPIGSGFAVLPGDVVRNLLNLYDVPATPDDPYAVPRQWFEMIACVGAVFYRFANSDIEHVTRFACAFRVKPSDRTSESLKYGIHEVHLTANDLEVIPQPHMTRAT
jgi:hypothetical protein